MGSMLVRVVQTRRSQGATHQSHRSADSDRQMLSTRHTRQHRELRLLSILTREVIVYVQETREDESRRRVRLGAYTRTRETHGMYTEKVYIAIWDRE